MSVGKPLLDYIETIKVKRNIRGTGREFRTLMHYYRRYTHLIAAIAAISGLKAYLFTLEPLYTTQVIDQVVIGGQTAQLPDLVLKIFLAVVGVGVLTFAGMLVNGYMAEYVVRDLRSDYYRSLEEKSFHFYDTQAVGDLISRATMDMQAIQQFSAHWLYVAFDAVFTMAAVLTVMLTINPTMALISVAPLPFIIYAQSRQFTSVRPLFRKMMLILGRLGAYIQQDIIGMKNVRIFRRENDIVSDFIKVEEKYLEAAIAGGKIQAKYMPSAQAILQVGIAAIYIYGTSLVIGPVPAMTVGDLTLYSRYLQRLVGSGRASPLQAVSDVIGQYVNASASMERISEIVNIPVDVRDRPDAKDILIRRGEVEFRDVDFGYAEDINVLEDISFTAKPGEKIAILGATGSGKTSLVYLIPRFYDVHAGAITIDGEDIRGFKLDSLRRQIGLVLQDVFLFTGTIRENIAFGKPDASNEEVVRAAKLAQIHDFVESLPEKYESLVGERGVTLSGGQKQRLTIARAILTNPKILILDDSLSFVDAKTEQEIQRAIEEAMKDRTTFIIAQRLSTIKNADRILVLEKGRVAEFGTHAELMAENGIYKRIYETQFLEKTTEEIVGEVKSK